MLYRNIILEDLNDNFLAEFSRRQEVSQLYIKDDDYNLTLVNETLVKDWDSDKKLEKIVDMRKILAAGGYLFGAFNENGKLLGFGVLKSERCGSRNHYMKLEHLYTNANERGKGIGKELFKLIADKARECGAEKLYISTYPAFETQAYYEKLGCVLAQEIFEPRVPIDIEREYILK
ncbi:MAG: GNAT family N-acetyltransferase [Spirochaetaceae bacterium]|nr:GNAT family N-acetyltransferase [Spirochaetaceae bacterium]